MISIQGELTITSDMEVLENSLFLDQVPPIWTARAYPSLLGLTSWFVDLLMRLRELETWSTDFVVIFLPSISVNSQSQFEQTFFLASISSLVGRIFQSSIAFNCHYAEHGQKERVAAG